MNKITDRRWIVSGDYGFDNFEDNPSDIDEIIVYLKKIQAEGWTHFEIETNYDSHSYSKKRLENDIEYKARSIKFEEEIERQAKKQKEQDLATYNRLKKELGL